MRRLIVFFLLSLLLILSSFTIFQDFNLYSVFDIVQIQVFTSEKCGLLGYEKIDNGLGEIYFFDKNNFKSEILSLKNVTGYTLIAKKDEYTLSDIEELLNVKVVEEKNDSLLGFSNFFPYKIELGGKNVSVQIVEKDDKFFIGTPLLLGSY